MAASASQVRSVVEDLLQDRVDQRLLGREGAEDGALGDPRGLRDLPGADVAAELLQQRLGRGDQGGSTFVEREGGGTAHDVQPNE